MNTENKQTNKQKTVQGLKTAETCCTAGTHFCFVTVEVIKVGVF